MRFPGQSTRERGGGGAGGEETGQKLGGWRRERTSEKVSEVGSRETARGQRPLKLLYQSPPGPVAMYRAPVSLRYGIALFLRSVGLRE